MKHTVVGGVVVDHRVHLGSVVPWSIIQYPLIFLALVSHAPQGSFFFYRAGARRGRRGAGSAVTCAASASKAWVVAWLAASSLPSPVAPLVDNVVGNVGHHRHRGLEDTSRWGWDLPTSKQGRI